MFALTRYLYANNNLSDLDHHVPGDRELDWEMLLSQSTTNAGGRVLFSLSFVIRHSKNIIMGAFNYLYQAIIFAKHTRTRTIKTINLDGC